MTLNLANNQVIDLAPLAPHMITTGEAAGTQVGLRRLEFLALDFNALTSISPLANMPTLKGLSLDGNAIADLSPLASWTEVLPPDTTPPLQFLSLDHVGLESAEFLKDLTRLRILSLSHNELTSVAPRLVWRI